MVLRTMLQKTWRAKAEVAIVAIMNSPQSKV
jgi:hypothetical protein